jgi:hypothetical protein
VTLQGVPQLINYLTGPILLVGPSQPEAVRHRGDEILDADLKLEQLTGMFGGE